MAGCENGAASEIALEIEELQRFLAQSKVKGVQNELRALVARKQQELERQKQSVEGDAMDVETEEEPLVEEVPQGSTEPKIATPKPVKVTPVVKGNSIDEELRAFTEISSFGWEDDGYGKNKVMVYILSGVDGVGELPKEQVTCDFTSTSFDLKILGLNGKNYRLRRQHLEKEIDPSKSVCRVKKNRVTLSLWKKDKNATWMNLTAKNPLQKAADKLGGAGGDPTAGIMDMMKNMYEEGDDEMKRTIAKAWTESREKTAQGTF